MSRAAVRERRGVLERDDVRATYEELEGRGLEFVREPEEMPHGVEALLRDDSGNSSA